MIKNVKNLKSLCIKDFSKILQKYFTKRNNTNNLNKLSSFRLFGNREHPIYIDNFFKTLVCKT